jgi:hypothetical protein
MDDKLFNLLLCNTFCNKKELSVNQKIDKDIWRLLFGFWFICSGSMLAGKDVCFCIAIVRTTRNYSHQKPNHTKSESKILRLILEKSIQNI